MDSKLSVAAFDGQVEIGAVVARSVFPYISGCMCDRSSYTNVTLFRSTLLLSYVRGAFMISVSSSENAHGALATASRALAAQVLHESLLSHCDLLETWLRDEADSRTCAECEGMFWCTNCR
jgi:hypothetical protein